LLGKKPIEGRLALTAEDRYFIRAVVQAMKEVRAMPSPVCASITVPVGSTPMPISCANKAFTKFILENLATQLPAPRVASQ
jgi:hypothetical protein